MIGFKPKLSPALKGLRQIAFTAERAPANVTARELEQTAFGVKTARDFQREVALRQTRAKDR